MDWLFRHGEGICHVRVTGVLLKEDHILVQRARGKDEYALPGGHLAFGETTEEALIREYREETGAAITCLRLLWTEENFWDWSGTPAHNLSFYYLIASEDLAVTDAFAPLGDNDSVEYGWLPVDSLEDVNIYPRFLRQELAALPEHPRHFIHRE